MAQQRDASANQDGKTGGQVKKRKASELQAGDPQQQQQEEQLTPSVAHKQKKQKQAPATASKPQGQRTPLHQQLRQQSAKKGAKQQAQEVPAQQQPQQQEQQQLEQLGRSPEPEQPSPSEVGQSGPPSPTPSPEAQQPCSHPHSRAPHSASHRPAASHPSPSPPSHSPEPLSLSPEPPAQGHEPASETPEPQSASPEPGEQGKGQAKPVLSRERLVKLKEKAENRGVVYISRIPPHMKPMKIRHLLSVHGELGRIYCAPEDKATRKDRKRRSGGRDTGKNFTEGWVEFEDKKVAKRVAAQLNGQPIGGKKRSAYYFDLWNLKYLPKFKWDHLTEEINYQRAVREQRLAAEISAAKKERDFYLSRVDKAKAQQAIEERRKAKGQDITGAPLGADGAVVAKGPASGGKGMEGVEDQGPRLIRQKRSKPGGLEEGAGSLPDDVLALVGASKKR